MTGPKPRLRLRLVVPAAVVVVFLAGMAAGGCVTGSGGSPPAAPARPGHGPVTDAADAEPETASARRRAPGELPVGWARSEDGARGAGVTVAGAYQGWLYLSDEALAASVTAVATPDAAERLVAELTGEVRLVRDALAVARGQVWWAVRPLAARVLRFSPEAATVAVWVLSVLSAVGVAAPQSSWSTLTVELAWVGGDWRVDELSRRPGPTPVLDASDQPWPAAALADALSGFELLGVGA
jgi:hypothetical protein